MPSIGTCFRFYTEMWVDEKAKHLHIEFIVTSHNSVTFLKLPLIFELFLEFFHIWKGEETPRK